MSDRGIALRVQAAADSADLAKGIARITTGSMEYLDVKEGDPISIINANAFSSYSTEPETIVQSRGLLARDRIKALKLRTVAGAFPISTNIAAAEQSNQTIYRMRPLAYSPHNDEEVVRIRPYGERKVRNEGQDIILLDGLTRKNANVNLNETVIVKKVRPVKAKAVVFNLVDKLAKQMIQTVLGSDIKRFVFSEFDSIYACKGDVFYPKLIGARVALTVESIEPKSLESDESVAALLRKDSTNVEILDLH